MPVLAAVISVPIFQISGKSLYKIQIEVLLSKLPEKYKTQEKCQMLSKPNKNPKIMVAAPGRRTILLK